MPSKQYLLNNFKSCTAMLNYAAANYDCSTDLDFIKRLANDQYVVRCHLASNSSRTFDGSGTDKREALAFCISTKFPS